MTTMENFDQLVRDRHSTRKFLPRPISRAFLDESLALAQLAPSNSNIQPWRMVFATGAARDRLTHALIDVARREVPISLRYPNNSRTFAQSSA